MKNRDSFIIECMPLCENAVKSICNQKRLYEDCLSVAYVKMIEMVDYAISGSFTNEEELKKFIYISVKNAIKNFLRHENYQLIAAPEDMVLNNIAPLDFEIILDDFKSTINSQTYLDLLEHLIKGENPKIFMEKYKIKKSRYYEMINILKKNVERMIY